MAADQITLPANPDAERAILGGILLENSLLIEAKGTLAPEHFYTSSNRRIYAAMVELANQSKPVDMVTLSEELGRRKELDSIGGFAYLASLTDDVPRRASLEHYIRLVKEKSALREAMRGAERLLSFAADGATVQDVGSWLGVMQDRLRDGSISANWRDYFHTYDELENAPPLRFAIDGFLQEAGVTMIGGLAGHGKTFVMQSMVKALLSGEPLFGCEDFRVPTQAERVLYLIPESAIGPFKQRLETFGLMKFAKEDRLFVRTLSSKVPLSLTDPAMLAAVKGADVFLDTAIRFLDGAENDAEAAKVFAGTLFALVAAGARTVTGAHHSPKGFETADFMTLENVLRGSGDIGAMLSTAWGIRQIDPAKNRIYVQNIKPREFEPCKPFIIEGRPWIEFEGNFRVTQAPGEAGELREYLVDARKGGAPMTPDKPAKLEKALDMRKAGSSLQTIADTIGLSKSGVRKWFMEYDSACTNRAPQVHDDSGSNPEGDKTLKRVFPRTGGSYSCTNSTSLGVSAQCTAEAER